MRPVYRSDRTYSFQVDGMAQAYVLGCGAIIWDTGIGKGHLAMGVSGLAFEDADVDCALIICEKNKLFEWEEDFKNFTSLRPYVYHGPRRKKLTDGAVEADVVITTYETCRNDSVIVTKGPSGRGRALEDGPFLEWLLTRRPMVVYDESTKLGNRSSQLYKAHAHLLKQLRKANPQLRVLGLTGTPVESDIETAFNQFRLIDPPRMPSVGDFEKMMIKGWRTIENAQGRVVARVPIWNRERLPDFAAICGPMILRKRKTDPDVVAEFPQQVEEIRNIEMKPEHKKLYRLVEGLGWDDDGDFTDVPGLGVVLRQVAGHPRALLYGHSRLAQELVGGLGAKYLKSVPSSKSEALCEYLRPLVTGQGAKVIVFTFFGQSVLPALDEDLRAIGLPVFVNHGQMTSRQQHDAVQSFRMSPQPAVLLTSDAGARGINVPEASYVVEYESALTHAGRVQRMNRAHRLTSKGAGVECVHCMTFVLTGTAERFIVDNMLARNAVQDTLLGDEEAEGDFLTAADRRVMFSMARQKSK